MATQKVTTSEAKTTAPVSALEAVTDGLTPEEVTRAKRVAALEKARAVRAENRTRAKRVAGLEKARKAKARKAKLRANAEKARAFKARLAEFEVRTVHKSDLVAFIEDSGLQKELLHFLDAQEAEAVAAE